MDEGSRRIVWGLCASLFLMLLVSSCAAAHTDYAISPMDSRIQNALHSLNVNQSADGKIVSDSTTAWAVMAFASAGIDPHSVRPSPTSPSAVDYLLASGGSLSSALDYARQILALSAADEPADKYVQTLLTYFDGTQFGSGSQLNDDIYALLAMLSVGMNTSDPVVNTTFHYIKSHQNADGGWSWSLSSTSDADTTAAAILALLAAGEPQSSSTITSALAFIKSRQNSDGGIGWDATYTQSNGNSDALAIMAIWAAGQDPTGAAWTKDGHNPVEHLLSLQRQDGSFAWNSTGDSTPDAIVALVGKFYPFHGFTSYLRVEGKNATLFEGDVFYTVPCVAIADNSGDAFDVFTEPCAAAQLEMMNNTVGIDVYATDAYGNYFVLGIAGENNSGAYGWQYAVNYRKASVPAEDCVLTPGDEVVWYYGSQDALLSILVVPEVVGVNSTFVAHALYYNQSLHVLMPLEGAYVWANGTPIAGPTNASGAVSLSFNASGNYTLWCAGAQSPQYPRGDWTKVIRSEKVSVEVVSPKPPCVLRDVWNRTYGTSGMERVYAVHETEDGGYILVGTTNASGSLDALLIKTDAMGNEQWSRTYGGASAEEGYGVHETEDGGYILVGTTNASGSLDALLIKTDAMGNEQWNRTYGGALSDGFCDVYPTPDGYVLGGWTYTTSLDGWLVKVDSLGNEQWNHTYGGVTTDYVCSFQRTMDGGYILAGYTNLTGPGDSEAWLVKVDSLGNEQWNRSYGGSGRSVLWDTHQTTDGGYILAGYTSTLGAGFLDAWLIKTDGAGVEQWSRTYGGANNESARSVLQAPDGGYFIAGYTQSYGAGGYDAWLIRTDAGGSELWNSTFGGSADDRAYAVEPVVEGLVLAGHTSSFGAGSSDAWLLKAGCAGAPPAGAPDLTVFMMLPPAIPHGAPLRIVGDVVNVGGAPANSSQLGVFANGTPIQYVPIPDLSPGSDYRFDFNYTPNTTGLLNITAIADYFSVVNESNESNNTATQYVDVGGAQAGVEVFIRVESNTTTLFNGTITVPPNCTVVDTSGVPHFIDRPTALGALVEAANRSGFTYNVSSSAYGLYVADINGDSWVQYRVNYVSPEVGADQYNLTGGEYVLFATGQYWPFYPLHIIAPPYVPSGISFNVTVIYYNDTIGNWTPIAGATVLVDGAPAGTTDAHGNLSLSLTSGTHALRAEKAGYIESTGYIRSEKVKVNVGGAPPTMMYIHPHMVWARPNTTFTIAISVSSMNPVLAAQYNITFNSSVLEVVNQTNGMYLVQDGIPTNVQKGYDNGAGYVWYNEMRLASTGVMGDGAISYIVFKVKDGAPFGVYALNFTNVSALVDSHGGPMMPMLLDGAVVVGNNTQPIAVAVVKHLINNALYNTYFNASSSSDPDGTIVGYEWDFGDGTRLHTNNSTTSHVYTHYMWNNGSYIPFIVNMTVYDNGSAYNYTHIPVMVYMPGDANGDGVSNILDAALVGLHWMASYGSPSYHDGADLNNDDVVNILDAAIVGMNWNRRVK